jgi:hypothetical protein
MADPGSDARLVNRGLKGAGLGMYYSPPSFRVTGITNILENGGTLEAFWRIASHADSLTIKLYDRRAQKVLLKGMERISILILRHPLPALPPSFYV